ncbi:MAG TPA: SIMPL domain-containing protein [Gemmatimonadales bacterium]|nr:SIMPL domain-containing protein [Gemmatimonadales bacterium]
MPWAWERPSTTTIAALIIAVGIALGGLFAGAGLARARAADRYVTVKGVAEREVQADLALWPLRVAATDNDLAAAQATVQRSFERIRAFLRRNGIDSTQTELQEVQVTDNFAQSYRPRGEIAMRFIVRQTLMVRSTQPATVLATSQRMGELVSAGVVLSSEEYGGGGPTFLFTKLNDVKPAMIAEATANAREAAEQFAKDSRTSLRGIRQASQGVFIILPRDQAPGISEQGQINKIVRVVSTVEYFLK